MHDVVKYRVDGGVIETTIGRIIFNDALDGKRPFVNETVDKKRLFEIIEQVYTEHGETEAVKFLVPKFRPNKLQNELKKSFKQMDEVFNPVHLMTDSGARDAFQMSLFGLSQIIDNYTKVVFVDGSGNSAMPIDYDFTDNSTEAGKTY